MDGMTCKRDASGFTMTELIITMSIVAILLAIGIPSFKYVTVSNRISTEVNSLLGDMQFARSEAIKQGSWVTVCSSTNLSTCNGNNGLGDDWQSGWIVFLDPNDNQTPINAQSIIRAQPAFSSTDTFEPAAANGDFTAITFNREGYAATNNVNIVTLELHDSTNGHQWTRCLAITPVGMVTTEKYQQTAACQ
jgi:type IV fimbrial biogenesis protein FimT